jgi:hypothetical protein
MIRKKRKIKKLIDKALKTDPNRITSADRFNIQAMYSTYGIYGIWGSYIMPTQKTVKYYRKKVVNTNLFGRWFLMSDNKIIPGVPIDAFEFAMLSLERYEKENQKYREEEAKRLTQFEENDEE